MGNIRLSYFNNGSSPEILAENNFYPFELKHEGYNYIYAYPAYNYDYNGKEVQIETGMLDYGWRQYMPELGRWTGMDMLTETNQSNTPYAYVLNNPVMLTDPDGRKVIPTEPLADNLAEGGALWHIMMGGNTGDFLGEVWSNGSEPGGGDGGDDEEEEDRGVDNNGQGTVNTELINSFQDTIAAIQGLDLGAGGPPYNYNGKIYETKAELYGAILVDQASEQFGIKDIISLAAALDNQALLSKPFQMEGASKGTSLASKYGSKLMPWEMPRRLPTHIRDGAVRYTKVLGRFVGRMAGPIGWGILLYDVGMTLYSTQTLYNNIVNGK